MAIVQLGLDGGPLRRAGRALTGTLGKPGASR